MASLRVSAEASFGVLAPRYRALAAALDTRFFAARVDKEIPKYEGL
jgi:hypothetical protein